MMTPTQEEIDQYHEEYLSRRNELNRIKENTSDSLDKGILQFSLAGLAILGAMLGNGFIIANSGSVFILSAVLILLCVSSCVTLIGYQIGKLNISFKLKDLDERYDHFVTTGERKGESWSRWRSIAKFVNFTSISSLILAVILFSFYSCSVIFDSPVNRENQMSQEQRKEKNDSKSENEKKQFHENFSEHWVTIENAEAKVKPNPTKPNSDSIGDGANNRKP